MRLIIALACSALAVTLCAAPPAEQRRSENFRYTMTAPSIASGTLERWAELYQADQGNLQRFFNLPGSPQRRSALRQFQQAWRAALEALPFEKLSHEGQVDYLLFRTRLNDDEADLALEEKRQQEIAAIVPFDDTIAGLYMARQRVDPIDPQQAAARLNLLHKLVLESASGLAKLSAKRPTANRAAQRVSFLRDTLRRWYDFYNAYDPAFTWWLADPYKKLDAALESYATQVRERLAGVRRGDRDTIVGDPIGREALLKELQTAWIPYTPEELIAIAEKEFVWCETEMLKASRELGFGDDWRKALEHVKTLYMNPGEQPAMVRNLALEAIDYVDKSGLVTIPDLARQTWRMEMMAPERQRINPFFLGGETIQVSYPTSTMTHEEKMMSMRGNNIHFSRATVHHELIPGHWLQQFMNQRHRPYRRLFSTPFWTEGWALYWEFILWDRGFPRGPEDRIGMLFWRMHRCARIVFSLSFHLEKMTPEECVKYLIERGGQEPDNASAEVRRSFEGNYGPLYQIAYMIGALQFRALSNEVKGRMDPRAFHDAILQNGNMPIELVRASILKEPLTRNRTTTWRFSQP